MNTLPLCTDEEYRAALKRISPLFDNQPAPGTIEGDLFEILIHLIEAYEAAHFPAQSPDPFQLIDRGLTE